MNTPVPKAKLEQFFAGINSRLELLQTDLADDSSRPLVAQPELEQFLAAVSRCIERQRQP